MSIRIIEQNDAFTVCIKPAGVISEEGEGSLPAMIKEQTGVTVYPVHRLDRGTAGLMVYANSSDSAAALSAVIRDGRFVKEYMAVVRGTPAEREGVLTDLLYHDRRKNKSFTVKKSRAGVKSASLEYKLVGGALLKGESLSLLHIRLHTGRTHQIRVQFSSRRLPLYGDGKYGGRTEQEGIALWSYRISFPFGGNDRTYKADPPESYPWGLFVGGKEQ